jgi:hypothetical protein
MKYILLDGVGAAFFMMIFLLGLVFIILAILIEAAVMRQMKFHPVYKKCLLQSLVANLLSLAAGFVLINSGGNFFQVDNLSGFAVLFVITLVIEWLVLYLMNRKKPLMQTLNVCVVMNLVTYAIAFLIILGTSN